MGSLLQIISPLNRGRTYGAFSASFLFLLILAEIEGLAFLMLGLALGEPALFVSLQGALLPAAWIVSASASGAVLWRARTWTKRRRPVLVESDVVDSFHASNWRERIGAA